ncbi:MAG: hypothetical protein WBD31_04445, partial [Rubripirellula sp.]
ASLTQGASVEVYRHDPGNWCAIRPLESSFSLVPESTLKIIRDGVGEVIVDDARAWVGTHLGAVEKPLWQVKLRMGERLKVVGEVAFPNPDGHSTIWYQIKPPPGEFRWIHRDDIRGLVSSLPDPAIATGDLASGDQDSELDTAQPITPRATLMRSVPPIDDVATMPSNQRRQVQPQTSYQSRDPVQSQFQNQILNRPAPPQPDFNTRDDRLIGSGLRRDLQIEAMSSTPQPVQLARGEEGRSEASQYTVQQSDFVRDADSIESKNEVQLASDQQEIVRPQDRDGINEGWRPSSRPFGQRSSSVAAQANASPVSSSSDSREIWNALQPSESFANEPSFATAGSSAPERFADAAISDRMFANNLDVARRAPVMGTYTKMPGGVAAVEARLTQEMLKSDPSSWELDEMERMAHTLAQTPNSAEELVNVNRLIAKIQNCQQLKYQYANRRGPTSRFDVSAAGEPRGNNGAVGGNQNLAANQNAESQFDAVGWLNELKRQQGAAQSTYVLQDANGKITHHLEAVPGLNLSRYLKTRIGVVGKRGYHQGLKLDHVLVSRVYGL